MSSSTDSIVSTLLARPLPPLEPGTNIYDKKLTEQISKLEEHHFVKATLYLMNDDIHDCHLIAQSNEGDPTGDLLHATLHRREGDYWNSKYWYSNLSSHPTIPSKGAAKSFVDACERVHKGKGEDEGKLREKQWEELKTLLKWTRENCKAS